MRPSPETARSVGVMQAERKKVARDVEPVHEHLARVGERDLVADAVALAHERRPRAAAAACRRRTPACRCASGRGCGCRSSRCRSPTPPRAADRPAPDGSPSRRGRSSPGARWRRRRGWPPRRFGPPSSRCWRSRDRPRAGSRSSRAWRGPATSTPATSCGRRRAPCSRHGRASSSTRRSCRRRATWRCSGGRSCRCRCRPRGRRCGRPPTTGGSPGRRRARAASSRGPGRPGRGRTCPQAA